MACYSLGDLSPKIDHNTFIAKEATIIGEANLESGVSVWPSAVIRADNAAINIGKNSNVQDGAVLHVDDGKPLNIGENVTIGHQVMLHGCTINDGSLIGIQAVILNGAVIGRNCLVGAGALVTENKEFPDRSMILGAPAKVVRMLTDAEVATLEQRAEHYAQKAIDYKNTLHEL